MENDPSNYEYPHVIVRSLKNDEYQFYRTLLQDAMFSPLS